MPRADTTRHPANYLPRTLVSRQFREQLTGAQPLDQRQLDLSRLLPQREGELDAWGVISSSISREVHAVGHCAGEHPERGLLQSAVYVVLLRGCVWAEPQRYVRRLHSLPYHPHELVVQLLKIGLIP
jgi:hypothetical protein